MPAMKLPAYVGAGARQAVLLTMPIEPDDVQLGSAGRHRLDEAAGIDQLSVLLRLRIGKREPQASHER